MAQRATPVEALETPAVCIRVEKLQANIDRMAALARDAGVKLRPHVKTHKTKEICALQRAAGCAGFTIAKPAEAQALGFGDGDDLFLAYPAVGPRMERLMEVVAAGARVRVMIDGQAAMWEAGSRISASGDELETLIEIDVGHHRTGMPWDDASLPQIVELASEAMGLEIAGVCSHGGHAYWADSLEAVGRAAREEGELAVKAAERLRMLGIADPVVSVGSTPTAAKVARVAGVTEIRPGTYVFQDATQVRLGAATPADCALRVVCRVVSRPSADRAVIDGGSKTFTSDRLPHPDSGESAGLVLSDLHGDAVRDDVRLARMSEEHGILEGPGVQALQLGDHVAIVPQHACGTVNLHEQLWVIENGRAVDRWAVVARGQIW